MKKILFSILAIFMGGMMVATPVFAAGACPEGCVETSILGENGCSCDEKGDGTPIKNILNLVVQIMTIGIGILGVIGITIAGIQYLTAGGNEAQVTKAKRRIFEIVIGLVAYVLIYTVLYWLIPDFRPF